MAVSFHTAAFSRFEKPALLIVGTEDDVGFGRTLVEGWLVHPTEDLDDAALKPVYKTCAGQEHDLLTMVAKDTLLAAVCELAKVEAFPVQEIEIQSLDPLKLAAWRSAGFYNQLRQVRSRTLFDEVRKVIREQSVIEVIDLVSR